MIYLVTKEHSYTVDRYFASERGRPVGDLIRTVSYEDLPAFNELPVDTYIFTDQERFTPQLTQVATNLWRQLVDTGKARRLLNNPERVFRRYELLNHLYTTGRNSFQAARATGDFSCLRFPVFVRRENDHGGIFSPLLHTALQVERAIETLCSVACCSAEDLLVVEYCDTSDSAGLYCLYSAYRIADRIIPCYRRYSQNWVVKASSPFLTKQTILDERNYTQENPHEAWIRETFEIAQIEYGRIDYSILNGRPQVWEINTNPCIGRAPRDKPSEIPEWMNEFRRPTRHLFDTRFHEALRAIHE